MASQAGDAAGPDLTPLLDVVLQLIMFFMVCANFVMEQVDSAIKLPAAAAARPIEASERKPLFLNVNQEGEMIALTGQGKEFYDTEAQIKAFLATAYAQEKTLAEVRGGSGSAVETLVIVRGDGRAEWGKVYRVMRFAREAGYQKVQLRAQVGG